MLILPLQPDNSLEKALPSPHGTQTLHLTVQAYRGHNAIFTNDEGIEPGQGKGLELSAESHTAPLFPR